MIRHTVNGISYYSFESFDDKQVDTAIFTRQGGVSPEPWCSLNVGGSVGDAKENVAENRRRLFAAIGKDQAFSYDVWQVHSNTIVIVEAPRQINSISEQADALLSNRRDLTLFMRFADCLPILLFDPVAGVIGLIHSGWVGTVNQIARDTINKMGSYYGSEPHNIIAGIGPSICQDHYEVGDEVIEKVNESFNDCASQLLHSKNGKTYFDLWKANELILRQSGVDSIELSGICTACHTDEWFSHRGEKGKAGRFGVLFSMK